MTTCGSDATSSTANPSGTVILAIASRGESGGPGGLSWRRGMKSSAKAIVELVTMSSIKTVKRMELTFKALKLDDLCGQLRP